MIWSVIKNDQPELPDIIIPEAHIYVRTTRADDYMEWANLREKNMMRLKPLEPKWMKNALTPEFFERRLKRQAKDWKNDAAYCFLIFEKGSDIMVGGVNLNNVIRGAAQNASLGYWICAEYEGKGYMREAVRGVTQYAFDILKLRRINAACLPHNERSKNLLFSLGFEEEGFAKKYLQINGVWQDHILFGKVNPSSAS